MFNRFCVTSLLCLVAIVALPQAQSKPPNVLLICVDDLKPTIGCYGDPVAVTPNLDALAARGVRFDLAYCNQAVCSPSRNSLMTGLRPQTIGVYDLSTHFRDAAPDAITVSQHFQRNGYLAEGLGKIYHTGHGNRDDADSWSVPSWRPKAPAYVLETNLAMRKRDAKGRMRGPATESADVSDGTYADGLIAEEAVHRLEVYQQQSDQPFFLAVGFLKPHLPFIAPQRYWDLYDKRNLPMPKVKALPRDAPGYASTTFGELRNYSDMPARGEIDQATTRHLIHGYYAATSYTDAQIGKLLDALDRLNLTDDTIVALWGDHGWHLGDHGMWCKHTNYEQAARIPIIIAAPGGARGAGTQAMIETVDLYPTLSELAGLPTPAGLDGQSFAGVIRDADATARDFVTHVYPRGGRLGRAIRNNRYRMVEWKTIAGPREDAEIELYDYQVDPLETENIAATSAAVVTMLRANLDPQPEAKPQWKQRKK
ncbi:Choline-sulfatase [Stieleria neptunia]|uniref:Choline-sulfatase n=1 Tax=Stieleria neptunia TaxID=2527979 RepID=A0A518HXQ7_9BACT|nr:sulfatase [Stieleria neptunia]QDV45648.1 Choline-sulfatase [Stieleria neptunia]